MPDSLRDLLDLGLCCPRCRGDLVPDVQSGEGTLRCGACGTSYPVILGIPDLRIFADPYIEIEPDRAKGRRLLAEGGRTWEDMVRFYYSVTRDTVPADQADQFAAGLFAARAVSDALLTTWDGIDPDPSSAQHLLEIGCGTAPLLVAAGDRAVVKVGVDIAFRWLVVGRQRLKDAGVAAHLVCACAEALPFRDARFDLVTTQGALENVRDQGLAMGEISRLMTPGGRLHIATANRFSLGPDPHLGLPAGGLMPERLTSAYARSKGALPPQRQLLSLSGLARLLRHAGLGARRYSVPGILAAQRRGRGVVFAFAAAVYELTRRLPVIRQVLFLIGPTLIATARKPAAHSA